MFPPHTHTCSPPALSAQSTSSTAHNSTDLTKQEHVARGAQERPFSQQRGLRPASTDNEASPRGRVAAGWIEPESWLSHTSFAVRVNWTVLL